MMVDQWSLMSSHGLQWTGRSTPTMRPTGRKSCRNVIREFLLASVSDVLGEVSSSLLTKERLRFQESWKVGTSQVDEYTVYCILVLHTRFISFLWLTCPQLILGSCVSTWSALSQPLWHMAPRGKALHTWHQVSCEWCFSHLLEGPFAVWDPCLENQV